MKNTFDAITIVPKNLFLLLTSECNLKCKHCHMWLNKDDSDILSTNEKISIIKEFQQINPKGSVIISGGEIMLKEDEFFEICRLCKEINLNLIAITNATMMDESHYEKLLVNGPDILFVSLDSHIEEVHDFIRGIKGSYQKTMKIIKDLVDLKKNKYIDSKCKIFTSTVLFEKNILLLPEFILQMKKLGIDGVSFQTLYRTYQNKSINGTDPFYDKYFFQDKDAAVKVIEEIENEYKNDSFIVTDRKELLWMKMYIRNPQFETEDAICGSFEKNIILEETGNYKLCGNMHELSGLKPLGNYRNISLKDFWISENTEEVRESMRSCRMNCGMFACHKKENLDKAVI